MEKNRFKCQNNVWSVVLWKMFDAWAFETSFERFSCLFTCLVSCRLLPVHHTNIHQLMFQQPNGSSWSPARSKHPKDGGEAERIPPCGLPGVSSSVVSLPPRSFQRGCLWMNRWMFLNDSCLQGPVCSAVSGSPSSIFWCLSHPSLPQPRGPHRHHAHAKHVSSRGLCGPAGSCKTNQMYCRLLIWGICSRMKDVSLCHEESGSFFL